jgi:hypothetical protein
MSKKFRVGQSVVVGGEYDGEIVGEQHTKKHGKVWLVKVEGEEHPILDKDLAPAPGKTEGLGEPSPSHPLPKDLSPSEEDEDSGNDEDGEGSGEDGSSED